MRFWKALSEWCSSHAHFVIALAATLIGLFLFAYADISENRNAAFVFLKDIEQRSLDLRFALRGKREADPRIVIVGIDEKTLQEMGSFPLPRSSYAMLVRNLKQDGAQVIAFDEDFSQPASSEALAVLSKLKQDLGKSRHAATDTGAATFSGNRRTWTLSSPTRYRMPGTSCSVTCSSTPIARRLSIQKQAEAYFNIVWAKAFPQVLKAGGGNFDPGAAWIQGGGAVEQGVEPNVPQYAQAAASYGFFNIVPDQDGTLRRALFMIRYRDQDFFPSLDLAVLQQYESIPDQQIAAYISADGLDHIQFGNHLLRPWHDGTALINYVGPYHSYPHYSMVDVMNGKVPAGTFRDKIVFVGPTALAIADIRNTPFADQSSYMGVEVHANILDNLLHSAEPHRTFLVRTSREELADIGFIILFGLGLGVG